MGLAANRPPRADGCYRSCGSRKQHLHSTRILSLSGDLPILIEAVDTETKIRAVLPELDEILRDGLITIERVEIITYRASPEP